MKTGYFLGIDVGTQGIRTVLLDSVGNVLAMVEQVFPLTSSSLQEQSASQWWDSCIDCLAGIVNQVKEAIDLKDIIALSVSSTSGTVIPIDRNLRPLHNAIMYSDKRSASQGNRCSELASVYNADGYAGFNSSSGLSKMVWYMEKFPEQTELIYKWIHAGDFIIGKLSGIWGVTDYTNVLKSGYDLKRLCWPDYLFEQLPLQRSWMPKVVPSGTVIGLIDPEAAKKTGLPFHLRIAAGMTDGCASQVASGAGKPGDWNTTIGTTLVIKGVTLEQIMDPQDRLYNHRHPEGFWMPGGAANIGADWISKGFTSDLPSLDRQASSIIPTGIMAYPLQHQGERFPFIAREAKGFEPPDLSRLQSFAAGMEGVAYVERYAYELIEALSGEKVKRIYTAGGGSNSDTWLTIRANVLNLPIYKMKYVTGATGAAIIAASQTFYQSLTQATAGMTKLEKKVLPEARLASQYQEYYHQFIGLLTEKGYITSAAYD